MCVVNVSSHLLQLSLFCQLRRPSASNVLRRCKFLLRKHRFGETAVDNPVSAVHYLQTQVKAVVDMSSAEGRAEASIPLVNNGDACCVFT